MNVCLFVQELSFKLIYKKQPLLAKNTDIKCAVRKADLKDDFFLDFCSYVAWND